MKHSQHTPGPFLLFSDVPQFIALPRYAETQEDVERLQQEAHEATAGNAEYVVVPYWAASHAAELLEALKKALPYLESFTVGLERISEEDGGDPLYGLVDSARALLSRIEGETK